ncbi:hypothetical protein MACH09_42640 [Vibrio sp. MACH09]|nr:MULTISPECIES: hypothetical protein [unclassified Vibrio]GLO63756.1 hypothetical protein MACH09_42640 [Vibrio sp. MACH09]
MKNNIAEAYLGQKAAKKMASELNKKTDGKQKNSLLAAIMRRNALTVSA